MTIDISVQEKSCFPEFTSGCQDDVIHEIKIAPLCGTVLYFNPLPLQTALV